MMKFFFSAFALWLTLILSACTAVDNLIKAEATLTEKIADTLSGVQEIRVKEYNAVVDSMEKSCEKTNRRGILKCKVNR